MCSPFPVCVCIVAIILLMLDTADLSDKYYQGLKPGSQYDARPCVALRQGRD